MASEKLYRNTLRIKSKAIKTWRFGEDMPSLSNANERDFEKIYIWNDGVERNIKFEEQKNEVIKLKVLLEWNRFWVFKVGLFSLINDIS